MKAMNAINVVAVYAIFNQAYSRAAELGAALFSEGVGDRETARPYALSWACKKYGVNPVKGQRGLTLARGTPAQKALAYVLDTCFPVTGGKAKSGSDKPVTKGQMFLAKVKSAKQNGLTYRTALAILNEAYGI